MSNLHAFKKLSFFSEFDDEELSLIAKDSMIKQYEKDVIVINEGDESNSIYFILSGTVRACLENQKGKEVILNEITAGDSFGELALFCDSPRTATIIAIMPCQLLIISKKAFVGFYTNNSKAALKIIKNLANEIIKITKDVEHFALSSVQERVLCALHKHAIDIDGRVVVNDLTHKELANLVASSRETVTRTLHNLKKEGFIQMNNGWIEMQ